MQPQTDPGSSQVNFNKNKPGPIDFHNNKPGPIDFHGGVPELDNDNDHFEDQNNHF